MSLIASVIVIVPQQAQRERERESETGGGGQEKEGVRARGCWESHSDKKGGESGRKRGEREGEMARWNGIAGVISRCCRGRIRIKLPIIRPENCSEIWVPRRSMYVCVSVCREGVSKAPVVSVLLLPPPSSFFLPSSHLTLYPFVKIKLEKTGLFTLCH